MITRKYDYGLTLAERQMAKQKSKMFALSPGWQNEQMSMICDLTKLFLVKHLQAPVEWQFGVAVVQY